MIQRIGESILFMFFKNIINKKIKQLDRGSFELLKHGKNYLTSSIFIKGVSIISIPVLTRLMSTSDYGLLSVFLVLVSIFGIIFEFGIRGAVSRYYYEKIDDFHSFFNSNLLFVFIAGIFLGIVIWFNRAGISNLMNIPIILVIFASFIAWISAPFSLISGYLQASKQSLFLSRVLVIKASFSLVFTIIITLLLKENRYLGPIYSQIVFSFVLFMFSVYMVQKIGVWDVHKKHLKYSLIFGLPMVLHSLSGVILNSFDQIMINKMVGSHEAGLYFFAYNVGMLFQMVIIGLNQAWVPIFYEKLRDSQFAEIEVTAKKLSYIISGAALVITILAPILVRVLAPKTYAVALPIVPILVVGFIFQYFYFMYVNYAFYAKKTSIIAIITITAGIVNIVFNYWLIPRFGYMSAAWATLFSYALFFLMQYINVIYNLKQIQKIPLKTILLPGIMSIFLITISVIISMHIHNAYVLFFAQASVIICYFIFILMRGTKIA